MTNRYLYLTLLAVLGFRAEIIAQETQANGAPRLVVSITIDQLRSDYLEAFAPLYCENGFQRLLVQGKVYTNATYPFTPIDRSSATAAITTGVTPYYNNITGQHWLNRETLRPQSCTDDQKYKGLNTRVAASPQQLSTSTIGDELKVATAGKAIVYSISPFQDAAVITGGHAADGALWIDAENGEWCSSDYYYKALPAWVQAYNRLRSSTHWTNTDVTDMALQCQTSTGMGYDKVTDLLCLTYSAGSDRIEETTDKQTALELTYLRLDRELERLINNIESRLGTGNVLYMITSTGYSDEDTPDYKAYRIPTGTFYMNRTANLMNMYLGAIWGQASYVETTYRNQIFLNHQLLETKKISLKDATERALEFLTMMSGVRNVYTSLQLLTSNNEHLQKVRNGYNPENCGDIVIEAAPGWHILNEDTHQSELSRASFIQFPIIFFGAGSQAERIIEPVTIDRIAPTLARSIRIRAPNACSSEPLF